MEIVKVKQYVKFNFYSNFEILKLLGTKIAFSKDI